MAQVLEVSKLYRKSDDAHRESAFGALVEGLRILSVVHEAGLQNSMAPIPVFVKQLLLVVCLILDGRSTEDIVRAYMENNGADDFYDQMSNWLEALALREGMNFGKDEKGN